MKNKLKLLCVAALICAAVSLFTACANWDTPYASLDKEGYTVSVRFDANGGMFAGTNDVSVVDVFRSDEASIKLLDPSDPKRRENAFEISRPNYFLAGWYQTRELRVNEQGEALDDCGNLCSVSGKPQGYVYGGKWDFATQCFNVDASRTTSAENTLTLYAAWVPYVNYEIYAKNPETDQFEKLGDSILATDLTLPKWNEQTGKLDMNRFPTIKNKTFDHAYTDEAMTQEVTDVLKVSYDEEKAILSHDGTVKVYTSWLDGTWFHIYNAKQFYNNSSPSGHYVLHADLDFTNQLWKTTLTETQFTGSIIGNGHKISNISSLQSTSARDRQTLGGLFGSIGAGAVIRDVTFENVSYTVQDGTLAPEASFGLLAGDAVADAVLENVTISGTLRLNANRYRTQYSFGLLLGTGNFADIDVSNIKCVEFKGDTETELAVDPLTGLVVFPEATSDPVQPNQ